VRIGNFRYSALGSFGLGMGRYYWGFGRERRGEPMSHSTPGVMSRHLSAILIFKFDLQPSHALLGDNLVFYTPIRHRLVQNDTKPGLGMPKSEFCIIVVASMSATRLPSSRAFC